MVDAWIYASLGRRGLFPRVIALSVFANRKIEVSAWNI